LLTFVLGLVFAIPLSVVANLATPRVQARLAGRSSSRATKQRKALTQELKRLQRFVDEPDRFHRYMLATFLRITLIGLLATALSNGLFGATNVIKGVNAYLFSIGAYNYYLSDVLNILGFTVSILAACIVVPLCLSALKTNSRINDFPQYRIELTSTIEQLSSIISSKEVSPGRSSRDSTPIKAPEA
jgi:hypothetical protein